MGQWDLATWRDLRRAAQLAVWTTEGLPRAIEALLVPGETCPSSPASSFLSGPLPCFPDLLLFWGVPCYTHPHPKTTAPNPSRSMVAPAVRVPSPL